MKFQTVGVALAKYVFIFIYLNISYFVTTKVAEYR